MNWWLLSILVLSSPPHPHPPHQSPCYILFMIYTSMCPDAYTDYTGIKRLNIFRCIWGNHLWLILVFLPINFNIHMLFANNPWTIVYPLRSHSTDYWKDLLYIVCLETLVPLSINIRCIILFSWFLISWFS